jgi:hypothetical protein
MRRFQARRGNGRFTRNTLANTFGLNVEICERPACRRMTPYALGEQKPTVCQACKLPFEAFPPAPGELEPAGLATGHRRGGLPRIRPAHARGPRRRDEGVRAQPHERKERTLGIRAGSSGLCRCGHVLGVLAAEALIIELWTNT